MRVSVVTFLGSNCDDDAVHVVRHVLGSRVDRVWHEAAALPPETDLVILPGGFSYGDALRAGALARFAPVMGAVRAHAERGGFVLGICNGFQVLLEAGLLAGAMRPNATRRFVCRTVRLRVDNAHTPFTRLFVPGQRLTMPVAHHEGAYYAAPDTLEGLRGQGRVVFRYDDDNPNGSADDIAGVVNDRGNILGLMPHPERAAEAVLGSTDGLGIFRSVQKAVEARA